MDEIQQAEADRRFDEALQNKGGRDPRDYYRDRLKDLRQSNAEAYKVAVAYYQNTLIPAVASGAEEPLKAWRDYGLEIARLTAPGRTVTVDASGRSEPYQEPCADEVMVLHLPDSKRGRALLVGLPPKPSPAQLATYDWLVAGKKGLRQSSTM